ncbi:trypsin-like serine protease [Pseudomonas anguilliseptica]|uniref:trypsin-like serine protease n=1 Tax=Pseudomonas anguilliseptica TaxID=53406 RepID=UPI0011147265|nr:trypsin-like serine protease [Pseudomonas anguilliseptica]
MNPSKNITLVALASAMLSACSTQAPSSIYTHPSFEAGNRQLAIEVISKGETSSGSAAWIGHEIVLTAAHLFLGASEGSTIRVGNGLTWGSAEIIAIDDPAYRDLAILKIDQDSLASLASPANPVKLCETPIRSGQEVLVASGLTKTVSSTYASPEMTRETLNKTS